MEEDKNDLIELKKLENPTLESDFSMLTEIFDIDKIGNIRLTKLIPEYIVNEDLFSKEIQKKIIFYKSFLWLELNTNITDNELFAWYKKISIDIDWNYSSQVWNYIFNNIIKILEDEWFKKSFISLELLKDIPKVVLDDYMKIVSADFTFEEWNIIKDIILWLENALATKYSKSKWIWNIEQIINWNWDLEHLMVMISHISKMDNDFKETLDLLYVKLLRYNNPNMWGLLRLLWQNIKKEWDSKKTLDNVIDRFSTWVSKLLWNFWNKEIDEKLQIWKSKIDYNYNNWDKSINYTWISIIEKIFLSDKWEDLKLLFWEDISKYLSWNMYFDKEWLLFIEGIFNIEKIIEDNEFWILIKWLIDWFFDWENILIKKERLTFSDTLKFIIEIQNKITNFLEKDKSTLTFDFLLNNIEIFKTDRNKRKKLLNIIELKQERNNPELVNVYRILGKFDKEFRKIYFLSNIKKIHKIQTVKTIITRNDLSINDVWEYLGNDMKNSFFESIIRNIKTLDLYNSLNWLEKELEYLVWEYKNTFLWIFKKLSWNYDYWILENDIKEIQDKNNIIIDFKEFILKSFKNREEKKEAEIIEISKIEKIEKIENYNIFLSKLSTWKWYVLMNEKNEQINPNVFESISNWINKYDYWKDRESFEIDKKILDEWKLLIWKIVWKWYVILNNRWEILNPNWIYFSDLISVNNVIIWKSYTDYYIVFDKYWKILTTPVYNSFSLISKTLWFNKFKWAYLIDTVNWKVIKELDRNIVEIWSSFSEKFFVSNKEIIRSNWEVVYKSILPIKTDFISEIFHEIFWIKYKINFKKFNTY